ncbi:MULTISPECIES: hypothetical protein [Thiorhodovibrio]|uniref:hypothetical protein n=1 Tax=Thiorhodovibrio TaxID=61593 RepID=UPI00191241D9|nr:MULTISPECIES: hypothetical protein [Thiorhodovibrio]MBK5969052.1 hypothetical protein [Thiorhodovibrio winogradskyi]WPL15066.1 hypothetical protein Thiosp_04930 [Thiorhodovibrio litoralis]
MHIFADGFTQVSLSNNNLRITLVQSGANNTTQEVGTLILPANQAGAIVNGLNQTLKRLDEQIKAQQAATTH